MVKVAIFARLVAKPGKEEQVSRRSKRTHEARLNHNTTLARVARHSREAKSAREEKKSALRETISRLVHRKPSAPSAHVAGADAKLPTGNSHAVE